MGLYLKLFLLSHLSSVAHMFSLHQWGDTCYDVLGRKGTCRPIYICSPGLDVFRGLQINRFCGVHWTGPLVCCPLPEKKTETTTTTSSTTPEKYIKPGKKAKYWCNKYSKVAAKIVHITGGEVARPREFPHMAAIGFGSVEKPIWQCGGSLISRNFILTAAHCLYGSGPAKWVRLGTDELENSVSGQTHPVIRRIPHPGYNGRSKYNDVALLEIGAALEPHALPTVGRHIHPSCLPSLGMLTSAEKAIATGWGQTEPGGDRSPILLKVFLNILNRSHCNETYENIIKPQGSLARGVDSTMICAGMLCGGKDTCKGDSGGPLQVQRGNSTMYEILGITSFGGICGCKDSPGVYTNVYEYVNWIENIVWS